MLTQPLSARVQRPLKLLQTPPARKRSKTLPQPLRPLRLLIALHLSAPLLSAQPQSVQLLIIPLRKLEF